MKSPNIQQNLGIKILRGYKLKGVRKRSRENKNGFTVAELLIVIAIVGILVAISLPIFLIQRQKAIDAVNKSNIRDAISAAMIHVYETYTFSTVDNSSGIYFIYDAETGTISDGEAGGWYTGEDAKYLEEIEYPVENGGIYKTIAKKIAVKIPYSVFSGTENSGATNQAELMISTCPHVDSDGTINANSYVSDDRTKSGKGFYTNTW